MADNSRSFEGYSKKVDLLVKLTPGKRSQLSAIAAHMDITVDRLASQIIEVWLIEYLEVHSGLPSKE